MDANQNYSGLYHTPDQTQALQDFESPNTVPTFAEGINTHATDPEETEWNSRLLRSKANRQKIEDNVNALRNRITFLENEEFKLIGKIEETKVRALEVIKIKRDSRIHNANLATYKHDNEVHVEVRKEEVSDMKTELSEGLQQALQNNKDLQMSKADEVKANLETLKGYYKQTKKQEQRENIEKVTCQKTFEQELEEKKAKILVKNFFESVFWFFILKKNHIFCILNFIFI